MTLRITGLYKNKERARCLYQIARMMRCPASAVVSVVYSALMNRAFFLTLSGHDEDVQVLRFTAQESLNCPWELDITLVSEAENISPEKMVGSAATLTLSGCAGRSYYHGQVWQFRRQTQGKRLTQYQLVMRPSLSWLGLGRNQRIFQQKVCPISSGYFCRNSMSPAIRCSGN